MITVLLGVLSSLVGALVWLVKSQSARADRILDRRDEQITRAISLMERSVAAFEKFEHEENASHGRLVSQMERLAAQQERITALQEQMLMKLDRLSTT